MTIRRGPPGPGVPSGDDALVGLRSTDEKDFAGEKRVPEDPRGPEGAPSGPPHIAALHRLAAYSLYRSATRPVCASPGLITTRHRNTSFWPAGSFHWLSSCFGSNAFRPNGL